MNIKTLYSRDSFGTWLNHQGLVGVGVEVGALSGGNARNIMFQWEGHMLHLVDTWGEHGPEYKERTDWTDYNACYKECQELANKYPGRVYLIKKPSLEAVKDFLPLQLDWVYIDSDHSEQACSADISNWWDKVKPGGIVGGHDTYIDRVWPAFCEVEISVKKWSAQTGLPYHYTQPCGSWWFVKP